MRQLLTIADLCLCRQRSDLASFQQRHDFQNLDQRIQRLIITLSEGPKRFEELRTIIAKENEDTREHIRKAFQQQQKQYEDKEYRKRLLESLWFNEIYSREENIVEAHRKTFEWIFDISDHAMGPWDNFIQWLESGYGTYWINGKAGSGKSTLMSFLCQDDRTMESLRRWSGNLSKKVLMPKFYFWSGGNKMQKSIEGLLRSLVWQVLQSLPDLDVTSSALDSRDTIPAWTERRLQTTLRSILQQSSGSHLFCLFIDGLDEYEGDQVDLVKFIQDLVQSDTVKVCVSSRAYRVFDQAFGPSASLKLQDLTHSDIQKFVVDRLQGVLQVQSIVTQRPYWLEIFTKRLLERANGVFLWVALAVKDQIHGLENGDNPEQLEERLEVLPDEVEGIYARMLGQIEKVYRKEASILLHMALHGECRSLLDFVLASQDRLEDLLSSSDPLPEREFIAKSHLARQRIVTTCAGLLEVNDKQESESHEQSNSVSEESPLESEISSLEPDNTYLSENASLSSEDLSLKLENASLEPDNTSLSEDALSSSEDVSLKSENASLEPDNESDDTSSRPGSESIRFHGEATDREVYYLHRRVAVNLIHRTALDFLRDTASGATFMETSTPSDFHASVSYVKVLLARTRLLGISKEGTTDIMLAIWSAENETGMAQTQLCAVVDNVMSRLDQTCGPWRTNSHWSIRWAEESWRSLHEDLRSLDSKTNSPSMSNDSFHSVNSEPHTPNDSRMPLVKKPDFLAFAVYYDLHRYVQKVIHDPNKPLGADAVSYLLYCAVHSLKETRRWYSVYPTDSQNLMIEFLRQGGNPNLKDSVLTKTIWSSFLVGMHRVFSLPSVRYQMDVWEETYRAYMETTVAFVEKGADLHVICPVASKSINTVSENYSLDLDLSALAVIELCSNNQLGHSHLRGLCARKGAPYYSRCTQVTRYEREARKSYKVSDHESTAILELYKKAFVSGSSEEDWDDEMEIYLDKLFHDRSEDVSESKYL